MILVATKTSQVPLPNVEINSTFPVVTTTFHTNVAVDEFKSGDETSVNTALEVSQVAYTCPIRFAPPPSVIQYSKNAAQPKSDANVSIISPDEGLFTVLVLTLS